MNKVISREDMVWEALRKDIPSAIKIARKCPVETRKMFVFNFYKWGPRNRWYMMAAEKLKIKLTREEKREASEIALLDGRKWK